MKIPLKQIKHKQTQTDTNIHNVNGWNTVNNEIKQTVLLISCLASVGPVWLSILHYTDKDKEWFRSVPAVQADKHC